MSTRQDCISLSLAILLTIISTVQLKRVTSITEAQAYLSQYGHLSVSTFNYTNSGLLDGNTWVKDLQDFQSFAGLRVTGELDKETTDLMSLPRCGVKDKIGFGTDDRLKRYVHYGGRWPSTRLTYKILNYPSNSNMSTAEVDNEIARAFAIWSDHTDLTFTRYDNGSVDMEIKFAAGEHGDRNPFDGKGGILAHAFFPGVGGDTHFDDSEIWTMGTKHGTNLLQVAAHEFGHALGLAHSNEQSALMSPFYRGYMPDLKLDPDDIAGIQVLYGKKSSRPSENQLCSDPKIDVIFNSAQGETFVFKGDLYYKLNGNSVADGYPKYISKEWTGLPSNIDAAYTHTYAGTFFFKDDQFWRYHGNQKIKYYPIKIIDRFALPGHFDAVMYRRRKNLIYLFKGAEYWKLDATSKELTKHLLYNIGLPNDLDSAFEDKNGYAYFFKGDKYYRLDDTTGSVDVGATPSYPRPTGQYWFGC